jgi:acyl carrier protein
MDTIIELLEEINPDVDYETNERLIDDHLIDSLSLLSLIAELEEEFDITVPAVEIVPDNFNSAKAIYKMVERLEEE